ncbi:sigma-54 dependent transcriptional regulator [Pedobacter sp. BMA]|uniref:sigma-54-dependent transcriptional regulator n=1 Tax=Pedobacter sp. BMA TaxID=1663685 RepID=UPI00064ADD00|nr:sigma-54 dependent transcriptional regulator [Pedobacter sp. BMA]KLT64322.1 Fis family transcriptional regulator [Pedobacter sp. BMA]
MTEKILIVEDEFIVAHDLQMILQHAGYLVAGVASSVKNAREILDKQEVDLVLLDIYLKGRLTGIDLAHHLMEREIPFIYISANSNEKVMDAAKLTSPYGFIVKPYRERDVLLSIDIARYRKEHSNQMKRSTSRLQPSNRHKQNDNPVVANNDFENIIGTSKALLNVLDKIKIVAPTDTSVLITGESGTGKEEVARSLHRLSPRKARPMVAVNCAALPHDLIESILFGHEKGAFTGAITTRIGKFEEANGGTIFLDEIGEMPFDLQAKLLRVLQEKEIERIGGKCPIAVDLRIIAATNLHLEKEIAKGKFRLDLFYRLNVFPIHVPSLNERKSDIPLLARYFVQKHEKALNKSITEIPAEFIDRLMQYNWPGNIRELEHLILRNVLLSTSGKLDSNQLEIGLMNDLPPASTAIKSISDNEKDHIIRVLELCRGKVAGSGGAAELLGIPATTLNSKIKKLEIKRS